MPAITFSGEVRDATGAAIHLSIHGENGFSFNQTFTGTFSRTLQLQNGDYLVLFMCLTDGECEFDIQGNFQSVNPEVPDVFDKDNTGESYSLIV